MGTTSSRAYWRELSAAAFGVIGLLGLADRTTAGPAGATGQNLVAVAVVGTGRRLVLATPGQPSVGWRFRILDTSDLPQPLSNPVLSVSGTKLLVQGPCAAAIVLDLTRQATAGGAGEYIDPRDPAVNGTPGRHLHRLPSERFVMAHGQSTTVVDDLGTVRDGAPIATSDCSDDHARPVGRRLGGIDGALLASLERDAAAAGTAAADWTFFQVSPDPELYVPVLEMARDETVFPAPFETLRHLGDTRGLSDAMLYERYLRQDLEARRKNCAIYYRVRSLAGSWLIEYWLYYPFDIGGVHSHLHDPEHVFVEVDKLGGGVQKVIGAGHGFFAGNNIFSTDRPLARPIALPLFVMVEFNKHATAPDIDRDGVFTPGIDENEFHERSKVWGVRDVIGTNNNHLLAYDHGMTLPRRPEDYLAPINVAAYFPGETGLAARACCRLIPLPADSPLGSACQAADTPCAISSVMQHPDFKEMHTILKEWMFPQSFLRATYGAGPGMGLHSVGISYSVDLDRTPGLGRILPLPGRVGVEAFAWHQDRRDLTTYRSLTMGVEGTGAGIGVRYERFLSNLFGLYSGVRVFSPGTTAFAIGFGPMIEVPLRNSGNVTVMPGLSISGSGSARFEINVGVGVWKPRSRSMEMPSSRHGAQRGQTSGAQRGSDQGQTRVRPGSDQGQTSKADRSTKILRLAAVQVLQLLRTPSENSRSTGETRLGAVRPGL